jgi:DAK2 domain fusion protein YloV
MPDPSIARFRRVVSSALASLEARRQEVNDLNVFPVADGDTGDNMAMTLRAVLEELDRVETEGVDGGDADEVGRTALVQTLARAALMGARGNSGVILSQIVRGAAEELASRPGELVDPLLVAAAFASAADAAYDSVREPAEGTMLTVFREMAHSLTRQLAHLSADKQRLGDDVSEEQQDAILAEVLERAIADGERAVARTPEQLAVLRESGVVDAGGHGLVLILAGVVAGLRGDGAALPEVTHREPPKLTRPHHEDSRYRYCTNFIVSGTGLNDRAVLPRLEALGDSVLVVGDEATLKVHVHTDTPEAAMSLFEGLGEVAKVDIADMRQQVAERDARLAAGRNGVVAAGRTGVIAVAAGEGMARLFAELGADVIDGGETLNPSTSEVLAGIHGTEADEVLVLPSSSNVIMAAERACELSEKPARVVPATSQQASLLALVEFDPAAALDVNAARLEEALGDVATGGVAPAARDDAQGRFKRGDAVGFAEGEIVAWGGAGSTLLATIEMLATDAEIVTVIGGDGAPIPLEEIDAHVPDGVELEKHEGGQPSWWWLLAAQ